MPLTYLGQALARAAQHARGTGGRAADSQQKLVQPRFGDVTNVFANCWDHRGLDLGVWQLSSRSSMATCITHNLHGTHTTLLGDSWCY